MTHEIRSMFILRFNDFNCVQLQVVSLSKEIGTLASELYTIPGEVAKTHGVGEKADAMVRKRLGLKLLRGH